MFKILNTFSLLIIWVYFGAVYEPQAILNDISYLQNEYTQTAIQVIRKNVNLAVPVVIFFMWLPALGRLYRRSV